MNKRKTFTKIYKNFSVYTFPDNGSVNPFNADRKLALKYNGTVNKKTIAKVHKIVNTLRKQGFIIKQDAHYLEYDIYKDTVNTKGWVGDICVVYTGNRDFRVIHHKYRDIFGPVSISD